MSRNLFRHLILNGVVAIPKNVRLPRSAGIPATPPEAGLSDLEGCLETYLNMQTEGSLPGRTHPFFGQLSPGEWSKFHVAHFRHHLKQFAL